MTQVQQMSLLNKLLIGVNILLLFIIAGTHFMFSTFIDSYKKENKLLVERNYACEHAQPLITTVYVPVISKDSVKYKPVPKHVVYNEPPAVKPDTAKTPEITGQYYSEMYSGAGYKIHWEAQTTTEFGVSVIDWIRFPEVIGAEKIVTKTKTIHDTVYRDVPLKLKSKFGIYGGVLSQDLKSITGFNVGGLYLHKQAWALQAGALWVDKKPLANVNFIFIF